MFKTKWLALLVVIMVAGLMGFTACSDDETTTSGAASQDTLFYGAWTFNDWTNEVAGPIIAASYGTGFTQTPPSVDATGAGQGYDFRCKGCHGWDMMGPNGGYVDKKNGAHANSDVSSGTASYVGTDIHSAATAAWGTTGADIQVYPALDVDGAGPTSDQMSAVASFLNEGDKFVDSGLSVAVGTGTAVYTYAGDATAGSTTFGSICVNCHGADGCTIANLDGAGGLAEYLSGDAASVNGMGSAGKYSEGWFKIVYGENDTMKPDALAAFNSSTYLTTSDAGDVLTHIANNTATSGSTFDSLPTWDTTDANGPVTITCD